MPDAAQARARLVRHRRHRDEPAPVPRARAREGRDRRRLPHPLARSVLGSRRNARLANFPFAPAESGPRATARGPWIPAWAGMNGENLQPTPRQNRPRHARSPARAANSVGMRPLPLHAATPYLDQCRRKNRMANRESTFIEITPEVLLKAY